MFAAKISAVVVTVTIGGGLGFTLSDSLGE
jgi:hypothetical protein